MKIKEILRSLTRAKRKDTRSDENKISNTLESFLDCVEQARKRDLKNYSKEYLNKFNEWIEKFNALGFDIFEESNRKIFPRFHRLWIECVNDYEKYVLSSSGEEKV